MPTTAVQLVLIIVALLPGVTYQLLRERWRGSVPGEQHLGERMLRALVASILIDTLAVLLMGPQLIEVIGADRGWAGIRANARQAAAVILVILAGIPAVTAFVVSLATRKRRARYIGAPSAWDHMFSDRPSSYVRARLKDGRWVGGWYGPQSFATSYPQPPSLYLTKAIRMDSDGGFVEHIPRSTGIYVRGDDIDILEFLDNEE